MQTVRDSEVRKFKDNRCVYPILVRHNFHAISSSFLSQEARTLRNSYADRGIDHLSTYVIDELGIVKLPTTVDDDESEGVHAARFLEYPLFRSINITSNERLIAYPPMYTYEILIHVLSYAMLQWNG